MRECLERRTRYSKIELENGVPYLKYPVVNLPEVAISSLNHVIRVGGVGFHLYNVSCVALIISLSSKNTHLPLPAYFLLAAI